MKSWRVFACLSLMTTSSFQLEKKVVMNLFNIFCAELTQVSVFPVPLILNILRFVRFVAVQRYGKVTFRVK
jgi:hypothetical protein